jgi:hypothetical protein
MRSGNVSISLLGTITILLCACGGGGGSATPAAPPPQQNEGSLAIADVDADDDGLIEIATLEQLDWVRNDTQGSSLKDHSGRVNAKGCASGGCKGFELMADLDFDTNHDGVLDSRDTYFDYKKDGSNAGWLPIGGSGNAFNAVFEGNHHRISNLHINRPEAIYAGLFGFVSSFSDVPNSIRNIVIDGPLTVVTGNDTVGILIGEVSVTTPTMIKGNKVSGAVVAKGLLGGGMIGRIAIGNASLTLEDNESSVSVSGGLQAGSLVGAILRSVDSPHEVTLKGNTASGAVVASELAGGLAGFVVGTPLGSVVMENCSASGKVTGQRGTGGLVGSASAVRISRSHASGDVISESNAGGLIGTVNNDVTVEESWSTSNVLNVTGSSLGGLIGSAILDNGFVTIHSSFAEGSLASQEASSVGGLVGYISGSNNARFSLSSSYSIGDVSAHSNVGGIVGYIRVEQTAQVVIENVFVLGRVAAPQGGAGGIVGDASSVDTASIHIGNAYAVNAISGDIFVGGLVGLLSANLEAPITFDNSYWAIDTTGQFRSSGVVPPEESMTGVHGSSLASLACPTGANDVACDFDELYHGWGDALNVNGDPAWRFSNPGQLPALRFAGGIHQPMYGVDGRFSVVRE